MRKIAFAVLATSTVVLNEAAIKAKMAFIAMDDWESPFTALMRWLGLL